MASRTVTPWLRAEVRSGSSSDRPAALASVTASWASPRTFRTLVVQACTPPLPGGGQTRPPRRAGLDHHGPEGSGGSPRRGHTEAKAAGRAELDPDLLAALRTRYDTAVAAGIIHNRHRDWDGEGNHPGYALATWLTTYADQVWLFSRAFDSVWTNNASERGVKPAKRHQAVSGYWQTDQTLARWCRINSYLTSARNHGLTVLDAIHTA